MSLSNLDIDKMRENLARVWEAERRELGEQREIARELKGRIKTLNTKKWEGGAVAYTAADGGDNRIRLDSLSGNAPAVVELVRIVDSDGSERVMETFAGTPKDEFLENSPPVTKLRKVLECGRISLLSPYLENIGVKILGEEKKSGGMSRTAQMREYREIAEWAVFYDLLDSGKRDTLLVREGALRTRAFTAIFFEKLDRAIRAAESRKKEEGINVYIAGVAKQTVLLNRLRFAFSMEDVFGEGAQYLHVPDKIAKRFYERRWLDTLETAEDREYLSFAEMYLVKFGDHPLDPVWPVDVAVWQNDEAEKILGYLARDARPGFPIPDFPMCIQKAHEHAKIGGIEMSYINDLLFEEMQKSMAREDPKNAGKFREKLERARYLGENITARRYTT